MDKTIVLELNVEQAEVLWAALRGVSSDSLMTYANRRRDVVDRVRQSVGTMFENALVNEVSNV